MDSKYDCTERKGCVPKRSMGTTSWMLWGLLVMHGRPPPQAIRTKLIAASAVDGFGKSTSRNTDELSAANNPPQRDLLPAGAGNDMQDRVRTRK